MKQLRPLLLSLLLAWAHPAALAAEPCRDDCRRLLAEGQALEGQGKLPEALQKYKEAETAAPQSSLPQSAAAGVFYRLSTMARPDKVAEMRRLARALAGRAVSLNPDNPVGHEVLRLLDDPGPSPLRAPAPEAAALMAQAEQHFAAGRLREALAGYEAVMRADPRYSSAWVAAGNCHFLQRDLVRAESLFRRATEIEPRNAQAWRFLASSLGGQGKLDAAETALLTAIAADPSQRPSWNALAQLRAQSRPQAHAAAPLRSLALRRGAQVEQGADGKFTLQMDSSGPQQTPDYALRLARAMAEANMRTEDAAKGKPVARSPFEIELGSWRQALKVAAEAQAASGKGISDPDLRTMQALERDGQLEPAILLLQFRQAYRPQLEAWLAAHPDGVRAFIDRYGLQP